MRMRLFMAKLVREIMRELRVAVRGAARMSISAQVVDRLIAVCKGIIDVHLIALHGAWPFDKLEPTRVEALQLFPFSSGDIFANYDLGVPGKLMQVMNIPPLQVLNLGGSRVILVPDPPLFNLQLPR